MPHPAARLLTVLAALLALAVPARADLGAARLWEIWRTGAVTAGQNLSAGRVEPGERGLVLHDLRSAVLRDGIESEGRLDWMRLDEQPDGSVRVTLAGEAHVESRFRDGAGQEGVLAMRLSQSGTEISVRETAAGLEQVLHAGRLALGDLVFTLDGVPQQIAFGMVAEDLTTSQTTQLQPGLPFLSRGSAAARRLTMTLVTAPPEAPEARMSLDATMEAPEWSFGLQAEDAAQAFSGMPEAGARVNFDLTYRHLSVQAVTGTVTPRTAELGAEAGRLQLSAGQDGGAALELHAAAARVVAAGPGVPLGRLSMTAAESLLRLDLPQSSAAGTMPFDLVLRLARLMPGPEHLAPGSDAAALAGEGASADLALAGRLRGAADMPAPALEELRLDRLRVNFADAELSGSGAVTLGDGAPGAAPPEGGMTFTLDGGDALLQALHAAGLIADNQIMGLRMMMAMFTLPGETPDSAVVRLAFSPEGRLLLNGAPLN